MLDDLERLGLAPDEPPIAAFRAGPTPYRQSDAGASTRPRSTGCATRASSTPATARGRRSRRTRPSAGRPGAGSGVRAACRSGRSPRTRARACGWRVGAGTEALVDLLAGPMADEPAAATATSSCATGGNWTYALLRGRRRPAPRRRPRDPRRDLLDATPASSGSAGCSAARAAAFLHHPLVRRGDRPEALEVRRATRRSARCSTRLDARRAVRAGRPPRWASRGGAPIDAGQLGSLFDGGRGVAGRRVRLSPSGIGRGQASTLPSGRTIQARSRAPGSRTAANGSSGGRCRPPTTATRLARRTGGRTASRGSLGVPEIEGVTAVHPHGRLPSTAERPREGVDLVGRSSRGIGPGGVVARAAVGGIELRCTAGLPRGDLPSTRAALGTLLPPSGSGP